MKRENANRKKKRELHKRFLEEVDSTFNAPDNLESMVWGRASLRKRNIQILRDIAEGADHRTQEFADKWGCTVGNMIKIYNNNVDVLCLLVNRETPEQRRAWLRLRFKRTFRKAERAEFKHDELDVLAEMRKMEGEGSAVTVNNLGVTIYIPQKLDQGKFDELVDKEIFNKAEDAKVVVNNDIFKNKKELMPVIKVGM